MAQVATAYVEVRPDLSNFSKFLKMGLAGIHAEKDVDIKPDFTGFNAEVKARIKTMRVPKIEPKIEPKVNKRFSDRIFKGITGSLKDFGEKFNVGVVGRIFGGVFEGLSGVMTSIANLGGKTFETLGAQMVQMGGKFGQVGDSLQGLGAVMIKFGGPVSQVIALAIGLGVAGTVLVGIMGALSTALGLVLAIVIPLIAGVTALIAEFIALGGAISASLLILPGAILGAAAAFAPLMAVMNKFQALFEKTATAVGPLYVVMERLKNAIFAVISSGFVKAFGQFAGTVLPQLFVGIDKVAQAWNKLLLGVLKLASAPGVIKGLNAALAAGAKLVGFFADVIAQMGPSLVAFATAALPALTSILNDVKALVLFFGAWMKQMTKSEGATTLFTQVALFVRQVLLLFQKLAPLAGAVMSAVIGPATRFIGILGQISDKMTALFSTVGGQAVLKNFFDSMNSVVSILGDLLVNSIIPAVLEFGDIITKALAAAAPLAQQFVNVLMSLLRNVLPGVVQFLSKMTAALADPQVQTAVAELGVAIGDLISAMGDPNTILVFVQALSLIADVATLVVGLINQMAPAIRVMLAAYKLATGDIKGLSADMASAVSSKYKNIDDANGRLGTSWKNLAKSGNASFDSVAAGVTGFANANAWQIIIDNANAASAAIGTMGRNAFEAAQLQGEKELGRFRAKQSAANARRATKPKIDTSGLSSAWSTGWNTAIDTSLGKAKTSTSKKINKFLTNLKPTITALNVMDFIKAPKSYDTGREIARYLAKGITSGSKNIARATDIIYKANKTNLDNLAKVVKDFAGDTKKYSAAIPDFGKKLKGMTSVSQLNDYFNNWKQHWSDLLDEIVNFKKSVVDALTPHKNLTGVFGYFPTPAEVKTRLDMVLAQTKQFTDGIAALQAKGLDPQLAREWLQAGVEGAGNMVQGLQSATGAEISAINDTYNNIGNLANTVAEQQAIAWKGVGEDTVRGYITGIEEMQGEVTKTMTTMLTNALKAAKNSLGIKSPSTVFAGIGNDTMAGYIVGINDMASATLGTVSDMYGAVADVPPATLATPQVKPALAHTGTLGQMAAANTDVNVKVYIGDRELTDMVRVVLDNADSTRARALYAGRRGG